MPDFTAHLIERPNPTPDDVGHVDRYIEFWTADTKPGDPDWYRDALWDAELVEAGPDSKEAQAEMQRRYANWKDATTVPDVSAPQTVEQLQSDLDSITEQRRQLVKQQIELESQIAELKNAQTTLYWQASTATAQWGNAHNWNTEEDGSGESRIPVEGDYVVIPSTVQVTVPKQVGIEGRVTAEG